MTRVLTVAVSGLVGAGLGALSGRILFNGSAWNLIPWAILAVAIGLIASDRGTTLRASGVYGYLLVVVFLYTANTSSTPFTQRMVFALALGLVGPVCSIAIAFTTRLIYLRLSRQRSKGR